MLQVTGVTNPLGLGFEAQAMIGIKTNGPVELVADEVATWRESSYVVIAAGQYDILVELVCTDRHHLLEIINRIRALDSVVSTESFMYLELWKQLYDWGAQPDWAEGDGAAERTDVSRERPSVERAIPLVSEMPHGGFKESGYGKDMSMYSVEEYTVVKHVMAKID